MPSTQQSRPRRQAKSRENGNGGKLTPWRELYSALFAPDFEIDERPIELREGMQTVEVALADSAAINTITGAGEGARDVISLVSSMMRREEKARLEAEAMRNQPRDDKEMQFLMKQMLPYLDSFDHVLEAARSMKPTEELDNWLKSVETLYFRALRIFERFGLAQLKTVGQVVNLDYHDVVEYRPSPNHSADTVIAERQKGYVYNNKLLRDAKVVVAMPMKGR